jgi:GNAT superfamily N-acetyltransferase
MTDLVFHPLTPDRWDDFVDLFETDSITRMCWCMAMRLTGAELREFKPADRKKMFQSLVKQGKAPGLLAYKGKQAVGWVAIAPRAMTPDWNRGRKSSAVEAEGDASDPACWGASCFFVRSGHRKQGMTADLLGASIAHAKKAGAKRLEACPMSHDDKRSAVGMCVGPQRVFERAGFETVIERKPGRPLMRLAINKTATGKKPGFVKKAAPSKKARASKSSWT